MNCCRSSRSNWFGGDFRNVDRSRGRFRSFVKTVVLNLYTDYYRRNQRGPQPIPENCPEPVADIDSVSDLDEDLLESWKQELLNRAWAALEQKQQESRQPFHTVLRLRAAHPDLGSAELAARLSDETGKPSTGNAVRQIMFRARNAFSDYLLADVLHSLHAPTREQVESELNDLGLLQYCQPALERLQLP